MSSKDTPVFTPVFEALDAALAALSAAAAEISRAASCVLVASESDSGTEAAA